jgi:hypothetical protein
MIVLINFPLVISLLLLAGMNHELTAVEEALDRTSKDGDKGTKTRQLALFKSLTKDVSDPTITLVAKLNCETNCELCCY